MVWMTLRLLCMPAQIIQSMVFTQIMDIWRPGRSLEDHLKASQLIHLHTSNVGTWIVSDPVIIRSEKLQLLHTRAISTKGAAKNHYEMGIDVQVKVRTFIENGLDLVLT